MIQASHKWGTLLLALLLMLQCGCARTVSTVSDTFFIELKLTLNGTVDSSNYNYYILFSTDADTAIKPQMIETLDEYFPSPAQNYSTLGVNLNANAAGDLSYYYSTYFSTWSDYILIQGNQANLVESGDTSFAADTSDNDTYINTLTFESSLLIDSTSITLVFEVDQLGLVENDTLYFRFLTAARTTEYSSTDQSGRLRDTIAEQGSILISEQQKSQNLAESEDSSDSGGTIEMASDIISWEVSIF